MFFSNFHGYTGLVLKIFTDSLTHVSFNFSRIHRVGISPAGSAVIGPQIAPYILLLAATKNEITSFLFTSSHKWHIKGIYSGLQLSVDKKRHFNAPLSSPSIQLGGQWSKMGFKLPPPRVLWALWGEQTLT